MIFSFERQCYSTTWLVVAGAVIPSLCAPLCISPHHFTGALYPGTHAPHSLRDKSRTLQHQKPCEQKYAPTCRFPQKHITQPLCNIWMFVRVSPRRRLSDAELLASRTPSRVCGSGINTSDPRICVHLIKCSRCSITYVFRRHCSGGTKLSSKKDSGADSL